MDKKSILAFEFAKNVALQSDFSRQHVGAIITYKGLPIATGCNTEKTHPMQSKYNRYRQQSDSHEFTAKCHAEIKALSQFNQNNYDMKKVALYIYRVCKSRQHGMARPCPACMQAIKAAGIRRIYYTTNAGYAEEVIS